MKLTPLQRQILIALRDISWMSMHAARALRSARLLQKKGLVESGKPRFFKITEAGRLALEDKE